MIAYKLCRILKNGEISSLFINKKNRLQFQKWLKAESHPTKGFALRPFWHCTSKPIAPHLSMVGRIWVKIEMREYTSFNRPSSQGGVWYLAKMIKLKKIV